MSPMSTLTGHHGKLDTLQRTADPGNNEHFGCQNHSRIHQVVTGKVLDHPDDQGVFLHFSDFDWLMRSLRFESSNVCKKILILWIFNNTFDSL